MSLLFLIFVKILFITFTCSYKWHVVVCDKRKILFSLLTKKFRLSALPENNLAQEGLLILVGRRK